MNTLTSLLFCNERYNACTIVNLQDLQNSLFSVPYVNLLQYITKIYNTNLLLIQVLCVQRLMVLKEVAILRLYICVYVRVCVQWTHCYEKKSIDYSLFTSVRKVQHCTGCPLIQVEIVSVKVNMCAGWLPKVLC